MTPSDRPAIRTETERVRMSLGDGRSWLDVRRGFVDSPDDLLAQLTNDVAWRQMEVLRYDRYIPERRLAGSFRGVETPPAIRQTGLFLNSRYGGRLDGPAALLYRNGEDFQGLHSDREMKWLDDTLVALLILGGPRPFVLRERSHSANERDRTPAGQLAGDIVVDAGTGDLLVMGGRCQRDWLHGVPQAAGVAPRMSVMWRWTSRTGEPDTLPSYFDGRQYSDRPQQKGYRNSGNYR